MRRLSLLAATVCALTAAPAVHAQPPGAPRGAAGPMANSAEFLLAHTGDLRLTDAQVVRLAAIARRADERLRTLRSSMDSVRPGARGRMGAGRDSTARAEMQRRAEQMRPALERMGEQVRIDRRDAIAVLTPDQQAQAWELVASGPRNARLAGGGRGARFGPGGRGMGPMGGRGLGPRPGDDPGIGRSPRGELRRRPDGLNGAPDGPRFRRPSGDETRRPTSEDVIP